MKLLFDLYIIKYWHYVVIEILDDRSHITKITGGENLKGEFLHITYVETWYKLDWTFLNTMILGFTCKFK